MVLSDLETSLMENFTIEELSQVRKVTRHLHYHTGEPEDYFANLATDFSNTAELSSDGETDLCAYLVGRMVEDDSPQIRAKGHMLQLGWDYVDSLVVFHSNKSLYAIPKDLAAELDIRNVTDAKSFLQSMEIATTPQAETLYVGLDRKLHKDKPDSIRNVPDVFSYWSDGRAELLGEPRSYAHVVCNNIENALDAGHRDGPRDMLDSSHAAEHALEAPHRG